MSGSIVELFRCLTHGVYVIGVQDQGRYNAFTAAWLTQVSFDPLLVALSVNPKHTSWPMLKNSGGFAVNILDHEQLHLAAHFGNPSTEIDKLQALPWKNSPGGFPILDEALAWLECRYRHECPGGDHVLIVAEVVAGQVLRSDTRPLTYRDTGDLDGSRRLYPEAF